MENKYIEVQEYYGKDLKTNEDLKTNACCTLDAPPRHIIEIINQIHVEVNQKYYGCGLTIPNQLKGLKILDLGSGSGRDCFIASKLVGQEGKVIGVDMTKEQLDVANKYIDYQTEAFGFDYSNVKFLEGNIDSLDKLDLEPNSFDLIISNCVVNLALNKQKVLNDAYALLKPGGEMYFSDVYSDRRISKALQTDKELWGECLSGALYWNDFLNFSKNAGFTDPRVVESRGLIIENESVKQKTGDIQFFSVTYRLFKIEGLESDCEDYGQSVKYKGTIDHQAHSLNLDVRHNFPVGKMIPVCGNSFKMLKETRFSDHFEFFGNWDTHYGIFEGCGANMPFAEEDGSASCC